MPGAVHRLLDILGQMGFASGAKFKGLDIKTKAEINGMALQAFETKATYLLGAFSVPVLF